MKTPRILSPATLLAASLAVAAAAFPTPPAFAQTGEPLTLPPASLPGLPKSTLGKPVAPGQPLAAPLPAKPIPLPPPRPGSVAGAARSGEIQAAIPLGQPAARQPAAEATLQPAALDTSPRAVLDRVNATLNAMNVITADFVQVGGNGRRFEGKLYVQKPGKLRFDYKPPNPLEIVADGSTVAIRDSKLGTQTVYPLSQTPLKFLLKEQIDLARDTKVVDVSGGPDVVSATVEDRTTFGGTSRVEMVFDPRTYALKQWTVTDPQGYQTTVNLQNVDLRHRPDPALFSIDTQRILGEK